MKFYWALIYLFTAVVESYLLYDLVTHRVEPRKTLTTLGSLTTTGILAGSIWLINMFHKPLLNVSLIPLLFIACGLSLTMEKQELLHKGRRSSKLQATVISALACFGTMVIVEILTVFFFSSEQRIQTATDSINNAVSYAIIVIFSKGVSLLVNKIIISINNPIWSRVPIKEFYEFLMVTVFTFPVYGVILSLLNYKEKLDTPLAFYIIASGLGIFMLNILLFVLFDRLTETYEENKKLSILELRNQYELKQFQRVEQANIANKQFLHDLENYLYTITVLLEKNEEETIKEIVHSMSNRITKAKLRSFSSITILDAILSSKYEDAKQKAVKMRVDVSRTLDLSFVDKGDLSVILTNLLDNAIEAASRCEEGYINFGITNTDQNEAVIITIENNFLIEGLHWKDGVLVTNKKEIENHGFGIRNIKETAEKYDGHYDYFIDETKEEFKSYVLLNNIK